MIKSEQREWRRRHNDKVQQLRTLSSGARVFNYPYGTGSLLGEWGQFKDDLTGELIPGEGVFDVRFDKGVYPISADNLDIL